MGAQCCKRRSQSYNVEKMEKEYNNIYKKKHPNITIKISENENILSDFPPPLPVTPAPSTVEIYEHEIMELK